MRWLQLLIERLDEVRVADETTLLSGGAYNFEDYRYLVGKLRGIALAMEIAKEVDERIMRE